MLVEAMQAIGPAPVGPADHQNHDDDITRCPCGRIVSTGWISHKKDAAMFERAKPLCRIEKEHVRVVRGEPIPDV